MRMNKRRSLFSLMLVTVFCAGVAPAAPDPGGAVRVPGAKYLFGISASPQGRVVLLYRSPQKPEGEFGSGTPLLITLKGSPRLFPLHLPSALDDLTIPVWNSGGRIVFLLTKAGIYSFDSATHAAKLIVPGTLAGLAISPDGTKLAYWNLGSTGSHYLLSVFSLAVNRTIRKWNVPTRFDADQYGHELVFSSDGASVLARTYDEEDQTPLKQFEIASGSIRTVWQNCSGLAAGRGNTYFVGDDHGTPTLFELQVHDLVPRKVIAPFQFDSLLSSGTRRWIVSENSRSSKFAVFDSETHNLTDLSSTCENAVVLPRGAVMCAVGGNLVSKGGQ